MTQLAQTESDETIALIYSRDTDSMLPLREFLEANGCVVYVNSEKYEKADYLIIYGDYNYVKQFSSKRSSAHKNLAVLYNSTREELEKIQKLFSKAVYVKKGMPDKPSIKKIFSFLFTSKEKVLLLDKPLLEKEIIKSHSFPKKNNQVRIKEDVSSKTDSKKEKKIAIKNYEFKLNEKQDQNRIDQTIKKIYKEKEVKQKPTKKLFLFRPRIVSLIIITIILPYFWYMVSSFLSVAFLGLSMHQYRHRNITNGAFLGRVASNWIMQGKTVLKIIQIPAVLIGQKKIVRNQELFYSFLSDVSDAQKKGNELLIIGKDFSKLILTDVFHQQDTYTTVAKTIERMRSDVPYVQDKLGLAGAALTVYMKEDSIFYKFKPVRDIINSAYNNIQQTREQIKFINNLLSLYIGMSGFVTPHRYLILFQNSMEIRPTGGFIGSVAEITMSEGKIGDFIIQDVYSLDGQLKGHADPPEGIKSFVGQEHWYLRDSNWNPDFAKSATQSAWFYEKETGREVDGVIGLSSPFIVDLLSAIGPVDLYDYNDRITADNFFGKSLYYVHNNFFPGSTQKRDFLGSLASSIVDKITNQNNINPMLLLASLESALKSHNLMFYFSDIDLQSLAEQYNWSGPDYSNNCAEGDLQCVDMLLGSVDANVSVNKVNYFIRKSQITKLTLTQDEIKGSMMLDYDNTSVTPATGSAGVYTNYLRVYLPPAADITEINYNGTKVSVVSSTNNSYQVLPYAKVKLLENQPTEVTIVFSVMPKKKDRIQALFSVKPPRYQDNSGVVLSINQPRQPGLQNDKSTVIIEYPQHWIVRSERQNPIQSFLANNVQLEYNSTVNQDILIKLNINK